MKAFTAVFKKVLLACLTIIIIFGLLEGITRIYMHFNHSLYDHEMRIEEQGMKEKNKDPNEKRIFVIGESAVQGVPMGMDHSMVAYLETLLKKQGYSNIKTVNLGMAERHSFYQKNYVDALIRYGADGVFLYAGNNDTLAESAALRDIFLARLDFELTYFSKFYFGLKKKIRLIKAKMNGQVGNKTFNPNQDLQWTDSKIFKKLEEEQRRDPNFARMRFEESIQYYETNLNSLVKKLRKRNIPVWIMELPIVHQANADAFDWSPNQIKNSNSLRFKSDKEQQTWVFWFEKGLAQFNSENYQQAETSFENAYGVNTKSLELQNLLYQTYLQLEKPNRAKQLLEKQLLLKTRVHGGHPWKTIALKRIAKENQATFIPLQAKMEEYTTTGILGKDLFLDDSLPTLLGHKIIASAMMQALCDSNFISCSNKNWRKWIDKFPDEINEEKLAKESL